MKGALDNEGRDLFPINGRPGRMGEVRVQIVRTDRWKKEGTYGYMNGYKQLSAEN